MIVLITGATGFIGGRLAQRLAASGHAIVAAVRDRGRLHLPAAQFRYVRADFVRDVTPDAWSDRVRGVDAVVNAVGLFHEHGAQTFDAIHRRAPIALFAAAAQEGIRRIVQLSALGADAAAATEFLRSKRDADEALLAMSPDARVAQPSLVYGTGGASAALLTMLASLPVVPLPGDGAQRVQPIHIDDLIAALQALVERDDVPGGRFALVGPAPLSLRDLLATLRERMALPPARFMPIARPLVRAAASIVPGGLVDRDALEMLDRGNTADPSQTLRLLGTPARPVSAFIGTSDAAAVRTQPAPIAPALVYIGAALDLALGVLVFVLHGARRIWLWRAQAALIVVYSAIIAWRLPEFWLHPYGPMLKNLPLLAAIALLHELEERA